MRLTFPRLIARNLAYHWRGNVAVLLGVAVGSAVLIGALLVGDSLRGSLRARAERQLAGVDAAALLPRPVRAAAADGMPGKVSPVLLLQGSVQAVVPDDDPDAPSLGRVTVLGVDDRFAPAGSPSGVNWSGPRQGKRDESPIVLAHRVADRLGVKVGDRVRVGVPRFSDLPRSSAMAKRTAADTTAAQAFRVAGVLPPDSPSNDFNLTPNPAAPLNVFVPIAVLSDLVRDENDRFDAPLATALLASGSTVAEWEAALRSRLHVEDYGLRFRETRRKYLSVESEQLVLPPAVVQAIEQAAGELGLRAEPTAVYVADTLTHGSRELPYPVVAGLNPAAAPPLGPFLPDGVAELKDNEIVLPAWSEDPLRGLPPGAKLTLTYFHPDIEGEDQIEKAELTLRGYIPLTGPAHDRDLTPSIRGVTDERADLFSWDRPPMLPKAKIHARVPDNSPRSRFWNVHKATPMAYVNLATAKRLFAGRFGSVTSVRVAPAAGTTTEQTAERLGPVLLQHLDPAAVGLTFEPIRERLLTASRGGTDFGGLFLGFSLFLIAAALMLVGLLFRLTLDRRAKEIGLLLATGYAVQHVRRLLLAEGLALAILGTLIGLAAAVGYNRLMLRLLLSLWPDPEVATFLEPHATATSFALGSGLTIVMAMGALWFSVRGLVKVPPPALLRGETTTGEKFIRHGRRAWGRALSAGAFVVGLILLAVGGFVRNPDFQAMTFFGGGALLLTAGLAALGVWMKRSRHAEVNGRGWPALGQLGVRNAARNPTRSLLTAALLASAAFLLVAVESFRREPGRDFAAVTGGSGGFNLIAEADVPAYHSFDTGPGRADVEAQLAEVYDKAHHPERLAQAKAELDTLRPAEKNTPNVIPLRLRAGDDASCMNLFQAARPRILGVPDSLIQRGGFPFYETEAATPEEKANPWLLLHRTFPNGAIPVFAENNTAVWMLKSGVGGEITMPDDAGRPLTLRIVGTLTDTPFQSELLMSDANFTRAFPKEDGYRMFLIHTPPEQERAIGHALEIGLRANGLTVTPTRERVAAYQAVIGAYLSTFQLLGGFGLALGVLGLAVVILRGVWERLGELALLRAMGYRPQALRFLVLTENALLLVIGLAVGVLAALASVAPHIAAGAAVPWGRLAALLAFVLIVGLGVAFAATAGILRVPVIPALRSE